MTLYDFLSNGNTIEDLPSNYNVYLNDNDLIKKHGNIALRAISVCEEIVTCWNINGNGKIVKYSFNIKLLNITSEAKEFITSSLD